LKDENSDARENAAEALGKITGQDFGEDQTKWQNWWNEKKKLHRKYALGLVILCLIILSIGAVLFFKGKKQKMRQ